MATVYDEVVYSFEADIEKLVLIVCVGGCWKEWATFCLLGVVLDASFLGQQNAKGLFQVLSNVNFFFLGQASKTQLLYGGVCWQAKNQSNPSHTAPNGQFISSLLSPPRCA